ncbi:MAG: hypothetical protein ACE5HX_13010, partial [bacterium]
PSALDQTLQYQICQRAEIAKKFFAPPSKIKKPTAAAQKSQASNPIANRASIRKGGLTNKPSNLMSPPAVMYLMYLMLS